MALTLNRYQQCLFHLQLHCLDSLVPSSGFDVVMGRSKSSEMLK